MKITQKSLTSGLAWALLLALIGAAVPTFLDWQANPAGVFRGEDGTNWGAVIETIWTWYWPLFLLIVPITVLIHAWRSGRGGNPGE